MLLNEADMVANYRYQLIAPIVSKQNMAYGEKAALLEKIAKGMQPGVSYEYGTVGKRTLERYIKLYTDGGLAALKPVKSERVKRIPVEYLEHAAALRIENPSRSIDLIVSMLETAGMVPEGVLKRSTVNEYFQKRGISSKAYRKKTAGYTRYGASYRGEILQGDFHHTMRLPQPDGGTKLVKLHAWIDDYSRLVEGEFYPNEKLPSLEDSLKKWIILYGIPEKIYTDNGSAYSTEHLKQVCARLGIQAIHSKPYRPMGRGKIERFFQTVENAFKTEAELLVKEGKVKDIGELNRLFSIWLDKFYNRRTHTSTKQKPLDRWNACPNNLRKLPLEDIYAAFLLEEKRKASKTGIISVDGNQYEVETFLSGKEVTVMYDPYDMTKGIRVFHDGRRYEDAVVSVLRRHAKKGYEEPAIENPVSTGINFLEILSGEKMAAKEKMSFSKAKEETV